MRVFSSSVRRARLVGVPLLLAACSGAPIEWLDFPPGEPGKTTLVSVQTSEEIRVFLLPEEQSPFAISLESTALIELVRLDESPAELSLGAPGLLNPTTGASRPLGDLTPTVTFRASLHEDRRLEPWVEDEALSPRLAEFPLPPRPSECPTLSISETIPIAADVRVTALSALPDGEALFASDGDRLHRVRGSELIELALNPPNLRIEAIFYDATHETLWAGTEAPVTGLWRGTLSSTSADLELVGTHELFSEVRWIDVDPEGTPFILTAVGVVATFDGVEVVILDGEASEAGARGGIKTIGVGAAIAAHPKLGNAVIHVEHGSATRKTLQQSVPGSMASAGFSASLGPVVGASSGEIHRYDQGWVSLGFGPSPDSVNVILPRNDGIIFAGSSGLVGQFYPDEGFCDQQTLHSDSIFLMVPLGDGYLVGSRGSREDNELTLIQVEPHPIP